MFHARVFLAVVLCLTACPELFAQKTELEKRHADLRRMLKNAARFGLDCDDGHRLCDLKYSGTDLDFLEAELERASPRIRGVIYRVMGHRFFESRMPRRVFELCRRGVSDSRALARAEAYLAYAALLRRVNFGRDVSIPGYLRRGLEKVVLQSRENLKRGNGPVTESALILALHQRMVSKRAASWLRAGLTKGRESQRKEILEMSKVLGPRAVLLAPALLPYIQESGPGINTAQAWYALAAMGPGSISHLKQMYHREPTDDLGVTILQIIYGIGAEAVGHVDWVMKFLESPAVLHRYGAAMVLLRIGGPAKKAIPALRNRMNHDPHRGVRIAAGAALLEISPSSVRKPMLRLMRFIETDYKLPFPAFWTSSTFIDTREYLEATVEPKQEDIPLLISVMRRRSLWSFEKSLKFLARLGPRAESALPVLHEAEQWRFKRGGRHCAVLHAIAAAGRERPGTRAFLRRRLSEFIRVPGRLSMVECTVQALAEVGGRPTSADLERLNALITRPGRRTRHIPYYLELMVKMANAGWSPYADQAIQNMLRKCGKIGFALILLSSYGYAPRLVLKAYRRAARTCAIPPEPNSLVPLLQKRKCDLDTLAAIPALIESRAFARHGVAAVYLNFCRREIRRIHGANRHRVFRILLEHPDYRVRHDTVRALR